MAHQAAIEKLKTIVLQTKKFHIAWDEFFNLAMQPQFVESSGISKLENLDLILHQIGQVMAPDEKAGIKAPFVLQYADSGLYHGPLASHSKTGTFMYFQDLNTGMAMLSANATGQTSFCRYTTAIVSSPHCYTAPPFNDGRSPVH